MPTKGEAQRRRWTPTERLWKQLLSQEEAGWTVLEVIFGPESLSFEMDHKILLLFGRF